MDKYLEIYTLPKLDREKTESINRQITNEEIQAVHKNFQETKAQ